MHNRKGLDMTEEIKLDSFSKFLLNEFEGRQKRNPSYSLRAFSSFLEVGPSVISNIFLGKSSPSLKYTTNFGKKLGLSLKEIEEYCKSLEIKKILKEDERFLKYKKITLDSYEVVSQWYHIAILYLRAENNIIPSPEVTAERLTISLDESNEAYQRLTRLNLIKLVNNEYIVQSDIFYENIDGEHMADASRKFLVGIQQKSLEALESIQKDKRSHSALVMSFNPDRIDEVKDSLRKFRKKFLSTYDFKDSNNQAFVLQTSFFPISKDQDSED
jgi:uncharacterized protein (TIGR02147 family)